VKALVDFTPGRASVSRTKDTVGGSGQDNTFPAHNARDVVILQYMAGRSPTTIRVVRGHNSALGCYSQFAVLADHRNTSINPRSMRFTPFVPTTLSSFTE
jgi:hypothetical protein